MTNSSTQTPAPQPANQAKVSVEKVPHSLFEDVVALIVGTLVMSFGVLLLKQAGALTGGTAGMAFLLHYLTGLRFGVLFFALNLPFYYLAFKRMGLQFVVKTFIAIALVSIFAEIHPFFIRIQSIDTFYACVFGNAMMGLGMLVLFRHRASLGGVNILALYLQDHYGIAAGNVQLCIDVLILIASFSIVKLPALIASVLGAIIINSMITMNHRPNRYLA